MRERIYFYTETPIDKSLTEAFLGEVFQSTTIVWIQDFYEFLRKNKLDPQCVSRHQFGVLGVFFCIFAPKPNNTRTHEAQQTPTAPLGQETF
jgi:hypothetical protein